MGKEQGCRAFLKMRDVLRNRASLVVADKTASVILKAFRRTHNCERN